MNLQRQTKLTKFIAFGLFLALLGGAFYAAYSEVDESIYSDIKDDEYVIFFRTAAWLNESNICASRSSGIPIPVSRTHNLSMTLLVESVSADAENITSPSGVNLTAFPSRFMTI